MASPDPVGTPEQAAPPSIGTPDYKASPELVAPSGWQKKVGLSKKGSASKRDVYFIAPDGEEIKTKRLLDRYLKSHPEGRSSSEFDWTTGETPTRRSSRLSTKTRPSLDSPKGASAEKRLKKTVEDKKAKDEEKGEPEQVSVEEPPHCMEKVDELRENVEESSEVKSVEEFPSSHTKGLETEAPDTSEAVVEGDQAEEEQKTDTGAANCVEINEAAKEGENVHANSSPLHKDKSTDVEEGSDTFPSVFQHYPEAPSATRQLDVST